ncbi:hypothetical protein DRP07_00880 [Archaeoglobales archaeon]|nr:MAG: hypothetical protein DRP07_00880 [Archaeoglobales archaeon]
MKFGKFIKRVTIEVIVARNSHQGEAAENKFSDEFLQNSAVLYLHPDYAKEMGFKEGDVVELESDEKTIRVKVAYSDTAPEKGGLMPNSIFSNYFVEGNMKKFEAAISPSTGDVTKVEEILLSDTK